MNQYNIIQLSDDVNASAGTNISENNVLWSSGAGNNESEIFLYNGSETIQLTNNDVADVSPQMSGDNIVWHRVNADPFVTDEGGVFLYNGSETIQLTDDNTPGGAPQISGNNVVWRSGRGNTLNDNFFGEIFFYNGSETIQLTDENTPSGFPQISGNNVVWSSGVSGIVSGVGNESESEIFFYNGSETIQLTDNDVADVSPQVFGDNVVWSSNNDIFFYNGSETIQLTDNDVADVLPQIFEDNVVWSSESEIFFYNGSETIQLTDNNQSGIRSQIFEDNVVWNSNDGEIFLYNGSETIQITDTDEVEQLPEIFGDNIVWIQPDLEQDFPLFSADLFLATPITESVSETVYRFRNTETNAHFYTANEIEKDAVLELDNFDFEGASYVSVDPLTGNPETEAVYRFRNQDTGVHLFTTSETEKDSIQAMDNFSFEGVAFYAYSTEVGAEIEGTIPIFRFFNTVTETHFYTSSSAERDNIDDNLPDFQSEGIAYYAFPVENI